MYARQADDLRRLTVALANGVGIGMGGDKAYESWLAGQETPKAETGNPAAARQMATIMRLQSLYGSQNRKSALRGAIRIRKPD